MKTTTLHILGFIFLVLFAIPLTSQVSIGFKAGTNLSSMKFIGTESNNVSSRPLVGLNVGIPFEFRFGKAVAFQPEVNFITKGIG